MILNQFNQTDNIKKKNLTKESMYPIKTSKLSELKPQLDSKLDKNKSRNDLQITYIDYLINNANYNNKINRASKNISNKKTQLPKLNVSFNADLENKVHNKSFSNKSYILKDDNEYSSRIEKIDQSIMKNLNKYSSSITPEKREYYNPKTLNEQNQSNSKNIMRYLDQIILEKDKQVVLKKNINELTPLKFLETNGKFKLTRKKSTSTNHYNRGINPTYLKSNQKEDYSNRSFVNQEMSYDTIEISEFPNNSPNNEKSRILDEKIEILKDIPNELELSKTNQETIQNNRVTPPGVNINNNNVTLLKETSKNLKPIDTTLIVTPHPDTITIENKFDDDNELHKVSAVSIKNEDSIPSDELTKEIPTKNHEMAMDQNTVTLTNELVKPPENDLSTIHLEENPKIVTNFAFKSKAGSLPNKPVKINQDSYILNPNFGGDRMVYLFGVCDGHGMNGHIVSGYIKHQLAKNFGSQLKKIDSREDHKKITEALHSTFVQTNKQLLDSSIDCDYSGATTVMVVIIGTHLWCSNVGDSRAILAKYKNGEWIAVPLSNDHKPEDPNEMKRIIDSGGRVGPYKNSNGNEIGPSRVWLKNQDIPGLAMTRSIGDRVGNRIGVIPEPEILEFDLEEEDKFIVIASDGIWEFMDNRKVIDQIVPFYTKDLLNPACEKLVRTATHCWKLEDDIVDDITCIIISLKIPPKQCNFTLQKRHDLNLPSSINMSLYFFYIKVF